MNTSEKSPIPVPLADDITLTFLPIPAGRFRMGQRGGEANEEPVTEVEVPEFWMGETPVTQEQYRVMAEACLAELSAIDGNRGSEPSEFKDREHPAQRPVEMVNWHEARVVARWLMGKMRNAGILPPGYVVDLPPEALWEYACRAGTGTDYWNGDGEAALAEVGWYDGNAGRRTQRVGEKKPNPWGLHDMYGNVWEWCTDAWDSEAYRTRVDGEIAAVARNAPREPEDARDRVLRGGSWDNTARDCRSACRSRGRPGDRDGRYGFRLCVFPGTGDASQGPEAEPEAESASVAKARRDDAAVAELEDGSSFAKATEDRAQAGEWDDAKLPPRSGEEIF